MTDPNAELADGPATGEPDGTNQPEDSVGQLLSRLVSSGRDYAEAELDRQKLRAGIMAVGIRDIAILGVAAVILLFGALITLLVGLVISLSPGLTPLGATAAVVGGVVLIVLIILLAARARLARMKKAIKG